MDYALKISTKWGRSPIQEEKKQDKKDKRHGAFLQLWKTNKKLDEARYDFA